MARSAASEQQPAGSLDAAAIAAYIRAECAHVTLPQVAQRFSCHPNSVTRLLKRELGQTFCELVAVSRVQKARDLLARGDLTVHEAALACGYANATHFYAVFKRHCGITPSAYHTECLARGQETPGARAE